MLLLSTEHRGWVSFRLGSLSQISEIFISPGNCSAREVGKLRNLYERPLPLSRVSYSCSTADTIYRTKASKLLPPSIPSQGQSPTPHPHLPRKNGSWKSEEKKIISSLKNWAVRMPNSTLVRKKHQCREVSCWKQTSLYVVCYLEQRTMKAAKSNTSFCCYRHHVHTYWNAIQVNKYLFSTYYVSGTRQGHKVRLLMKTEIILVFQILQSNKEDQ